MEQEVSITKHISSKSPSDFSHLQNSSVFVKDVPTLLNRILKLGQGCGVDVFSTS